jgi:IPT/TIG domain
MCATTPLQDELHLLRRCRLVSWQRFSDSTLRLSSLVRLATVCFVLLTAFAPAGSDAAQYTTEAVGSRSALQPKVLGLSISSFNPNTGPVGSSVTITGTGFSSAIGSNIVKFNGTPAMVMSAGSTNLVVVVPTGATTGPISVSVGPSTATSSQSFVVTTTDTDTVWVEDAVPAGGTPGGEDGWNWVSSNPAPYSGTLANQSVLQGGLHQHYFYAASATLSISAGDTLTAYVYLDPANLPSEMMLQWNDGSWEHRAYWGANLIVAGTDGTASRQYVGVLPPAGQWVRLSVPAAQVGLVGSTLNGMAFALYDGRATWDHAGKSSGGTASQTISFAPLVNQFLGAAPLTLSATASSGLVVGFFSLTTTVCTVSGTTVTLVTLGTCTIHATQAGNASFGAAPNVDRSFAVGGTVLRRYIYDAAGNLIQIVPQ